MSEIYETITQRTIYIYIYIASALVIVNNHITTPGTHKIRPKDKSFNLDVPQVHRNIFETMTLLDSTLKLIIIKQ